MAQGKFDIETALNNVKQLLQANLNTKLAAIDAEKADGITLAQIPSGAYILQSLDQAVAAQFNPFVLYGIDKIDSNGIGPSTAKSFTVSVIIIVADPGSDPTILTRLLRYLRALEEVFEDSFGTALQREIVTVESLEPVQFRLVNSNDDCRAIGVSLKFTIS
jgi:hypothetical protein